MPDIVYVGIERYGPAQDRGVKASLVDEVIDKGSPLQDPYLDLDAYLGKTPLNNLRTFCPDFVPLIRDDFRKQKVVRLYPVYRRHLYLSIRQPREAPWPFSGRMDTSLHWSYKPRCPACKDCGNFSQAQQDALDDLVFIDGICYGLPHRLSAKSGFFRL